MRITTEFAVADRVASVVASGVTDVGRVRGVNEDSFVIAPPLFLVADGMGGHTRGDVASRTAAQILRERLGDREPQSPDEVLAAIRAANDAVRALGRDEADQLSGTTLVGVALVGVGESRHWMVFNVGDSRLYSWDGRTLRQLSVDHSVVQELLDAGEIDVELAAIHPERNVITRAIGAEDEVDVDVWLLPLGGRQTFLICSDGLTKELDDGAIAATLARLGPEDDAAEALVAAALAVGGHDNVTVVRVDAVTGSGAWEDTTATRPGRLSDHLEDTRPRA